MTEPRILAFAGSVRRDSFNKKLVAVGAAALDEAGIGCTPIDLGSGRAARSGRSAARDLPCPPGPSHRGPGVQQQHHAAPQEHDRLDQPPSPDATPDLRPYQGKVAALMAASPGPLGGLRGLGVVRELLFNVGVTVLPGPVTVRAAHEAFVAQGRLDERRRSQVEALALRLAERVSAGPA